MTRKQLVQTSRRAALVLFWPALALVIWGELSPSAGDPLGIWDKALHFTAYFGLAGLATVAFNGGRRAIWAATGLALLGAALEIVQGMVGRDMSLYDEVANILGVMAGFAVAHAYLALLDRRHLVGRGAPD